MSIGVWAAQNARFRMKLETSGKRTHLPQWDTTDGGTARGLGSWTLGWPGRRAWGGRQFRVTGPSRQRTGDQGWLSPAGEKRLRTGLSAARCQLADRELAQEAQRARPGPAPTGAVAQPLQPASALALSPALVRSQAPGRRSSLSPNWLSTEYPGNLYEIFSLVS